MYYVDPNTINSQGAYVAYGSDRPRKNLAIQDAVVAIVTVIFARHLAQGFEYEAPGLAFLLRTIVPIGAACVWLLRRFVSETTISQPHSEYVQLNIPDDPYYYTDPQRPGSYFYQDPTTRVYFPIVFDTNQEVYGYYDSSRRYRRLLNFTLCQQRTGDRGSSSYRPSVPGPTHSGSYQPATTMYSASDDPIRRGPAYQLHPGSVPPPNDQPYGAPVYGVPATPGYSVFSSPSSSSPWPAQRTYSVGGGANQHYHGPSQETTRAAPTYRPGTYPPPRTDTYEVEEGR